MPRFTARPVTVEAYRYDGNTLNMEGAFNSVFRSYQSGGPAIISYGNVAWPLRVGDWLIRGADGVVTPVGAAAFEAMFQPESDEEEPSTCPTATSLKRPPGRPPKTLTEMPALPR